MEKIKRSFTKTFLILLIANVVITLLECAKIPLYTYLDGALPKRGEILTVSQYLKANFDARGLWSMGINLVTYLVEMPFLCGVYSLCFARLKDAETSFGTIFYFYRSPKRILLSMSAVILTNVLYKISMTSVNSVTLLDTSVDINFIIFLLLMVFVGVFALAGIVAIVTLYFWSYSYASNPDDRIESILVKSFCCSIFAILIALFNNAMNWIYERVVPENMQDYFYFIPNTITNWICVTIFAAVIGGELKGLTIKILKKAVDKSKEKGVEAAKTAAYNIGGSYVYAQNSDFENNEIEEEKPFIEPYDFFIEEDRRFNDEKVIETEDIRGVDILAVLDEMNLIDDIKVNYVIRKKLKKMFEELSFEIGEYVTYIDGREINDYFTEEIDGRIFTVSVAITRSSNYNPFILDIRIYWDEE